MLEQANILVITLPRVRNSYRKEGKVLPTGNDTACKKFHSKQYIRKHNSLNKKGLRALLDIVTQGVKDIVTQVVYEKVIEVTKAKLLEVEEDENEVVVLSQTEKS